MAKTKILVIGDDESICEVVKLSLEKTRKDEVVATTSFLFISKPITPKELVEQVESALAVITRQKAFVKSLEEG